jgi:hypothetical protein
MFNSSCNSYITTQPESITPVILCFGNATMHFHLATACSLLALADTAFAHYRWTKLIANGATTSDYQYVRLNTNYNSPVTDVTSNDIRCNTGTQANAAKTSTLSVAAGSTVGLGLDQAIYHQSVSGELLCMHSNTPDGKTNTRQLCT